MRSRGSICGDSGSLTVRAFVGFGIPTAGPGTGGAGLKLCTGGWEDDDILGVVGKIFGRWPLNNHGLFVPGFCVGVLPMLYVLPK